MSSTDRISARRQTERFEELLDRTERVRVAGISFDELRELGRLYRAQGARLARLRDRLDDADAIRHLNALCVRAYTLLYAEPPARRAQARWFDGLPEAIGRTWRAQVLAWCLLLIGMAVGGALGWRSPQSLHLLVPEGMGYSANGVEQLAESAQARAEFLAREGSSAQTKFFFGSALFVHNTRVGLLAFATGMLVAIPTILLQLYNGILLGAFASMFFHDPFPVEFLAWILPHGIPEITAITLCTSAGLVLGAAIAAPGRHGRREALRNAVSSALVLVGGSVPLFVLAAIIESSVRESLLGTNERLGVAIVCLLGLVLVLRVTHRLARALPPDTAWLGELISEQ